LKSVKRLVILGVGSQFRSDDAAGIFTAKLIKENISKSTKFKVDVLLGETAPENLTGEIKKLKPTHLMIIDSADLSKKPGTVLLLSPRDIKGISFCTHQLPPSIMINYLKSSIACEVSLIAIQPKNLKVGDRLSKEVSAAVKSVSSCFLETVCKK
jgi:hydrogenase 3 maturation protease